MNARWQYFVNPWWQQHETFFTTMTRDECRRAIEESTTYFLSRAVARSIVSTADFTLHRTSFFRNSFRPYAYVRLNDVPSGGTLVKVTLSSTIAFRIFAVIWLGFLVVWTLLAALGQTGSSAPDPTFVVFAAGFAVFLAALVFVGRATAFRDSDLLIAFLRDRLDLREPPLSATPIA